MTIISLVLVIFSGIAVIIVAGISIARSRSTMSERIRAYAEIESTQSSFLATYRSGWFNRVRFRLNALLSSVSSQDQQQKLLTVNWPITAAEYSMLRIGGTLIGFALGWVFLGSPLSGVGVAIMFYILPEIQLGRIIRSRRQKFQNQLVDVLVLMSGAVRAGYSLLQSLDVVVEEMSAPASEEFRRVRREVELGLPLNQALIGLTDRMTSDDLYLVVTAININSQVGGNLTVMLGAVTHTIRERIRLFGEVRVLTSYAKYSGYVLTFLPFIVAGLLFMLNPDYASGLFAPGFTRILMILAIIGIILGNIAIRLITRIEI